MSITGFFIQSRALGKMAAPSGAAVSDTQPAGSNVEAVSSAPPAESNVDAMACASRQPPP